MGAGVVGWYYYIVSFPTEIFCQTKETLHYTSILLWLTGAETAVAGRHCLQTAMLACILQIECWEMCNCVESSSLLQLLLVKNDTTGSHAKEKYDTFVKPQTEKRL